MSARNEYPDLKEYDTGWNSSDQSELFFLHQKYTNNRPAEGEDEEFFKLRKLAEKNKTRADGTPNPHYPRMSMEADIARMQYEMGLMVRVNAVLWNQLIMMEGLYQRVGLLEGAYGHLQQSTNYVKNQYRDSMKKHFEERKEWSTQNKMRAAGLNPDSQEDRLKWAKRMDELTAKYFNSETEGAKL